MTTALQKKIKSVKKQSIHHHTLLRYEQRKVARSEKSKLKVVEELHSFQLHMLPEAQNRLSKSLLQMSQLKEMTQSEKDELICQLNDLSAESEKLHSAAIVSQKRINALIKMVLRASKRSKRASELKKSKYLPPSILNLCEKGTYTSQAHVMAWALVDTGCSQDAVGRTIKCICKYANISVKGVMSHRTVQRAILEGGIASDIQLAHELIEAKCK